MLCLGSISLQSIKGIEKTSFTLYFNIHYINILTYLLTVHLFILLFFIDLNFFSNSERRTILVDYLTVFPPNIQATNTFP